MSHTITEYIVQDLEQRIQTGQELPRRFTLESLAQLYQVSLTPVRLALAELIKRQVIQKNPNGRLVPITGEQKPIKEVTPSQVISRPKDWSATLTEFVLRESLKGEASFLREEAIAEKFGTGRTIVRQLFGRLAGSGMVDHVPRRGWRVVPFRERDMTDYIIVREMLEVKALDLAKDHLERHMLEEMLAGNKQSAEGEVRLDNRLHTYIIEQSGNRYIKDYFRLFGSYYTSLFDYAALGAEVVDEMVLQHREILEAALQHDWPKAKAALAFHIRAQEPVLKKFFDRLTSRDHNR
jgi:DNA-binding GntR family transcriptional regulator